MNNTNTTKHSIRTSLTALLLCFVMLLGTTFAWFTDVSISEGNVIQAGTLDIRLVKGELSASTVEWKDTEGKAVFDYDKWEPGYVSMAVLAVENHGTLSAKWKAKLTLDGTPSILADVIDVYVTRIGNYSVDRPDFTDGTWQKLGSVREILNNDGSLLEGGIIDPDHRQPIIVAVHMREDAGNEYQGLNLGANFNISILATQASAENDSFGNDYDADAIFPDELNFETTASLENVAIGNNALVNDLVIRYNDSIYAELSAGTKLAAGVSSLKFSGKPVESTNSNITLGEGDSAKSYDIHIEGIADDNDQPIKVYLGAILNKGLTDTELKLYHEGEQMTWVESVDKFIAPNQYFYNSATGEVVLYVNNFSEFQLVKTSADEWDGTSDISSWYNDETKNNTEFTLTTAEQFAGFRDLVDGGNTFAGKTIKLGKDINLARKVFDPIGFGYYKADKVIDGNDTNTVFMGTFDGQGYTIYNLYQNCWELDSPENKYATYTYSTAGGGLFASIKDATIKNLVVNGAEVVFECVDIGVVAGYAQGECHFENIIVTNANIANYNRYTGGLVAEVSYGTDNNDDGYTHTFKNITIDSSVTVSGLWGSFGCGMGGVIGGKWGDAKVYMENVISAPVMDVYNDVVSAYQWYAFRGCGMLIGHTEEPYSDGRTSGTATASFLKCENVSVYYGDWVNYTYYEFANQTDAGDNTLWYSNYPWVRAEAGEYCDAFSNIRYGIPLINGVKVTELSEADFNNAVTGFTTIAFDQLYGADRGMYGCAAHDGVKVYRGKETVKTVYFENTKGWDEVYIYYWSQNGDDEWDNLPFPGQKLEAIEGTNVYTFEVPAFAKGFIFSDGKEVGGTEEHWQTHDILLSDYDDVEGKIFFATNIREIPGKDGDGNDITIDYMYDVNVAEYKEGYKTVCFQNSWNWYSDSIRIYYWCNNGTNDFEIMDWDDRPYMNLSGTKYSINIPKYAEGFIITGEFGDSRESVKTPNISLEKYIDGETITPIIDQEFVLDNGDDMYTIYFRNDWYWTSVKIHHWGSSSVSDSTWAGELMTKVGWDGTYDIYRFEIAEDSKFLFNGYDNGSLNQSPDITSGAFDGAVYYMHWDGSNKVDKLN